VGSAVLTDPLFAPGGEAPGGVLRGPAGTAIVNLPCETFQDALCGFWCRREEWRRLEIRRGREDDFGDHAVEYQPLFSCPLPGRQACDKGRYHTQKQRKGNESEAYKKEL
jgi:hypothetical protein